MVNSTNMLKKLYVFLPLVIFFHTSCVENIIFIQVYPDGQTYFKFISTGDSTDINDQDFRHPFKDDITVNSSSNITKQTPFGQSQQKQYIKTLFLFFNLNTASVLILQDLRKTHHYHLFIISI